MSVEFLHDAPLHMLVPGSEDRRFGFTKNVGAASIYAAVDSVERDTLETWGQIAAYAQKAEVPIKVLGGGTNVYLTEEGFHGLLVTYRYEANTPIHLPPASGEITCEAALPLAWCIGALCMKYERPFGNLAGIPGTLGGGSYRECWQNGLTR